MSKKDLSLKQYGISKFQYRELSYRCQRYSEFKRDKRKRKYAKQIERAAQKASPELYSYILKNVTQGIPYEQMPVPLGRRQFYQLRQEFFINLANLLEDIDG